MSNSIFLIRLMAIFSRDRKNKLCSITHRLDKNVLAAKCKWFKIFTNAKKKIYIKTKQGFPSGLVVKNPPANPGNMDLIPGSRRYPRDGNSNLPQYSCLGNPRGPWQLQATGSQRVGHDFRDWAHTYPQRPNKEIRVTQESYSSLKYTGLTITSESTW